MDYRRLTKSDLKLSALAFGCIACNLDNPKLGTAIPWGSRIEAAVA